MALNADELAQAMTDALAGSGLNQSISNLVSATTSLEATIKGLPPGSIQTSGSPDASQSAQETTVAIEEGANASNVTANNTSLIDNHLQRATVSGNSFFDTMKKIGGAAFSAAAAIGEAVIEIENYATNATSLIVGLDNAVQDAFGNIRFAQFGVSDIANSAQGVFEDALREVTDFSRELRDTSDATTVSIMGNSQSSLQFLFGAGEEGMNQLQNALEDFYNSGRAESEKFFAALTKDEIKRSVSIGKALGLAADVQADLVQKSIDRTGKASSDLIEEVGAYAIKIQQVTGASSKTIASGIASLITDVETFGDIGVDSAARISGALANLGVQMQSFSGLVSKFMNFDTAVSSIGDLTSAFGLQLDAMEMFRLANEDEEEFLKRIREEFQSQGIAVEDLNKSQLSLLKSTLGFSDVGDVQNFLREGTVGFDEMTEATEDVDIAASFEEIVAQGKPAAIAIEDINKSLQANAMLQGAKQARDLALNLAEVTLKGGELVESSSRAVREATYLAGVSTADALLSATSQVMKGDIKGLAGEVEKFAVNVKDTISNLAINAFDTVTEGLTSSDMVQKFLSQWNLDDIVPEAFRHGSLSPFGKEILKGITDPEMTDGIIEIMTDSFSQAYDNIIELQETKLMPAIISNFESFESMISSQVLEPNTEFLNNLVDEGLQSSAQTLTGALQNAQVDLSKKAIESIDLGVEVTGDSITATAVPITDSIGKLKESAEANLDLQKKIVENGNELLNSMTQLIDGVSNLKSAMETPSVIENKTVLNLNGRVLAEVVRDNSYNPSTGEAVLISNEYDLN